MARACKVWEWKVSERWQVLINPYIVISVTNWQQSCAKLGGKGAHTKKDQ